VVASAEAVMSHAAGTDGRSDYNVGRRRHGVHGRPVPPSPTRTGQPPPMTVVAGFQRGADGHALAREILRATGAPKVVGDHGVLRRRLPLRSLLWLLQLRSSQISHNSEWSNRNIAGLKHLTC
jgi:hypothetical protein